ncbi:archaeosortase/exosortase family protein, partial [Myxococcota bacterium]|nr:archaeosortase/exosortase family protein [Myxococcota bacterium]
MSGLDGTAPPPPTLRTRLANPQLRYPLLVLLYLGIAGGLVSLFFEPLRPALDALEIATARCVAAFMSLFSSRMTSQGDLVTYDGFSVSIIIECVGILEMVIYSACVLAFPASARERAIGVPLGCLAIFAFNVLRIATLLVVGRHWHAAFDFFHLYF